MNQRLMVVAALGLIPLLAACAPAPATPPPTEEAIVAVASPTEASPATSTPIPKPTSTPEGVTEAPSEPEAAFPTPNPNPECVAEPIPEDPNIPPATADEWSKGLADAPITLLEYSDFQ